MTGYKLGWTLGPEELIRKVQAIHQTAIYSAPTITQVGLIFLDDYANDYIVLTSPGLRRAVLYTASSRCLIRCPANLILLPLNSSDNSMFSLP